MTDQAHTQLDDALEALARPEPPTDHVVRVLARSGPQAGAVGTAGSPPRLRSGHASRSASFRWRAAALATAATVLVALGATWPVGRMPVALPDVNTTGSASATATADTSASGSSQPHGWGVPQEIYRPELPPQADWGTDALEEWKSLRPGLGTRESGVGSRAAGPDTARRARRPEAAMAWVPVPSGLPPIELESIEPAPVSVPPLAPLEDIALAAIPVEPIVIAPLIEEETP